MQGAQVRSLVGELRTHMPGGQKPKNMKWKQYCNKFNKDFKTGPHQIKKKILKTTQIQTSIYRTGYQNKGKLKETEWYVNEIISKFFYSLILHINAYTMMWLIYITYLPIRYLEVSNNLHYLVVTGQQSVINKNKLSICRK